MLKFIAKLILIPVLSGLISLIYWKLVIYHGFPMINIFSREFDGENAYNCIFIEIFLIIFFLLSVIFCVIRFKKKYH